MGGGAGGHHAGAASNWASFVNVFGECMRSKGLATGNLANFVLCKQTKGACFVNLVRTGAWGWTRVRG